MFIRHRHDLALMRRFPHALGLKALLRHGKPTFHHLELLPSEALMGNPARRDLVLAVLELMRVRYRFAVIGYVVMPEHVHLLISEPLIGDPREDNSGGEAGRLPAAGHWWRIPRSVLAESFLRFQSVGATEGD